MISISQKFSKFFDLVPEKELGEAEDYLRLLTVRWTRAVALLMVAGVLVAWPTDFLLFENPAYVEFLAIWRTTLGLTTLLLAIGLSYVPWIRNHPVAAFCVSAVIVMTVSGAAVGRVGGADNPFLYSVYSIPATTVALLTTLPRRIFATLAIAISYLAGFFFTVQPAEVPLALAGPFIFLVASCIGMIFIGHVVYRLVGTNRIRQIRLEQVLEDRERDLALAAREALTAHEKVRERVLRDLHDNVGPIVTVLHLETFAARQDLNQPMNPEATMRAYLDGVDAHARNLKKLIRNSLRDLDPFGIDRGMLTDVLCSMLEELGLKHQYNLECDLDESINGLPVDLKRMIYLVVRECAHNTLKHARAEHVRISIRIIDQALCFRFEDDGKGAASVGELTDLQGHYGLAGIRLRAIDAGGKAELTSAPGKGFRVAIDIPLTEVSGLATAGDA